jgi:TRAP-type C4-dicarboxylate transport system substrate-binding protein
MTAHDNAAAPIIVALQAWCDDIATQTNGDLTIDLVPGGELAAGTESYDVVRDGQVDLAWFFTMYETDIFPLTEVPTLPMNGPTHPAQMADVLYDLLESTPEMQAELDASGVKVLQMYGNPENFLSTVEKPIKSLADLNGMALRCPTGGATDVLKLMGAKPEAIGPGDVADNLQKGVIQGCSWEFHGIQNFKLYEYLKYYNEGLPFYEGIFIVGINSAKYDSLPQWAKDVLDANSGREVSVEMGKAYYDGHEVAKTEVLQAAKDGGFEATLVEAGEINLAEFQAVADSYITDTWAPKWSEALGGFDTTAYVQKMKDAVAAHPLSDYGV